MTVMTNIDFYITNTGIRRGNILEDYDESDEQNTTHGQTRKALKSGDTVNMNTNKVKTNVSITANNIVGDKPKETANKAKMSLMDDNDTSDKVMKVNKSNAPDTGIARDRDIDPSNGMEDEIVKDETTDAVNKIKKKTKEKREKETQKT